MQMLELRNVSKNYGDLQVLHGVSLTAAKGSVTALLGRSGCGKTTLLNLAGAMDFPTRGEVLIDGRATSGLTEPELTRLRRTRIGFIFQFFQLLPSLSAAENVELPLLLAGEKRAREAALASLEWVGIPEKAPSMPFQLSGGQMQRVAIARALVHSPELLIADEPTGNLDSASGAQVLALIRRAAEELGAAVIMATHSAEAAAIARRRIHLRDGRIEEIDES
jgi:ABC-type lipoprotein export system ATPase subunit